ncbi:MAG: type IV secretory system conjugative DNA transfer family protein, partial [Acidimicrobiia bacterium]|nr:type IV secretory system conjugative DNA transfer family protein [Acidimicrobiia bacterium]
GLIVAGLGLLGMIWGAAVASSWFVTGEPADIGVSDAALAMARFGTNGLSWEGAWSPAVEESLAGPGWFWLFFAAEVVIMALLFWPAWRLFGPRPSDPLTVVIEESPARHPRAERRRAASEARARTRRFIPAIEALAPPPTLAPTIDKILVSKPSGQQVVLGRTSRRLVATVDCGSVIVFGPTQAGKTSALTVPAVLEWSGPALVVAAKPDVISRTWRARAMLGGEQWLFDPMSSMAGAEATDTDTVPGRRRHASHGWSPLQLIEAVPRPRNVPELDRRVQQWGHARRTAQWMVEAARNLQVRGEMPEGCFVAAEQMLAPMLLAAADDELSIGEVAGWVDRRDVAAVAAALEEAGVDEASTAWAGSRNADSATAAGAYQILSLIMAPYGDPRVLDQTRRAEISAYHLLDGEPNTLFVLSPLNHQQRLRPLMTTLVSQVLDAAMGQATGSPAGRLRSPLLVVFDDAAACAPLQLLDQLASAGAGLGIQVITTFQDLGTIDRTFGPDCSVQLANNHRARVILPGVSDVATLDYVNELIRGSRLVGSTDAGRDGEPAPDPVVLGAPTWMRTLDDGDALCVYGNLPPLRMALRPWFADQGLQRLVEPPAEPKRRWRWRRRRRQRLIGGGFPNPLDSDANNREADRYWESVVADGTLPPPREFDDGSALNPGSSLDPGS